MARSGLAFGQLDPNFPADPKFRKLARMLDVDDFLHAVGTWTMVLAGCYRYGTNEIDAEAEAGSTKSLDALRTCGLLDDAGVPVRSWEKWRPRPRPKYPSDGVRRSPRSPAESTEDRQRLDGDRDETETTPRWLAAWLSVKYRMPTVRQQDVIDAYLRVFDVTGSERAAGVILGKPDDPMGALMADLRTFRGEAKQDAEKAETEAKQRRSSQRRGFRPGTVEYELAQMLASKGEA